MPRTGLPVELSQPPSAPPAAGVAMDHSATRCCGRGGAAGAAHSCASGARVTSPPTGCDTTRHGACPGGGGARLSARPPEPSGAATRYRRSRAGDAPAGSSTLSAHGASPPPSTRHAAAAEGGPGGSAAAGHSVTRRDAVSATSHSPVLACRSTQCCGVTGDAANTCRPASSGWRSSASVAGDATRPLAASTSASNVAGAAISAQGARLQVVSKASGGWLAVRRERQIQILRWHC